MSSISKTNIGGPKHNDKQTYANNTKTFCLTFLSSSCFQLINVTVTYTSQTAVSDDNEQDAHLPVTDTGRGDGTWSRRDQRKTRQYEKQQLPKSLFTAARATGTENKHWTVKKKKKQQPQNTALNTLLGGVVLWADGDEKEQRLHWACWANVVLPRQPHHPCDDGEKKRWESENGGWKSQHHICLCLL